MFTFLLLLYYNYNGDSMKDREQLVFNIKTEEDLSKLDDNKDIKYINIDITTPNKKVIDYLIKNGQNLLYTETINDNIGYIYVDYEMFKNGQKIVDEITKSIPTNLTKIELAKWLYIKLGSFISYDINTIPEKNEVLNLSAISTINNIWGSLSTGKGTNHTFTKLYYYLCKLNEIDCKLIKINEYGYQKNIIKVDSTEIITDITNDLPYIQGKYKTRFFGSYNDDINLDRNIGYTNEYSEKELEKIVKTLDYNNDNFFKELLLKTQGIINVKNIGPIELGIIYNDIFNKYCPSQDISINNLYIKNQNHKEHFILITQGNNHYSFNYNKKSFVEIPEEQLLKNIDTGKIGIYDNENVPLNRQQKTKVA